MRRKWLENPGGGISRIEELTPEEGTGSEVDTATEKVSTEVQKPQRIQTADQFSAEAEKKTAVKKKKAGNLKKQLAKNGQTLLDVSKGDIRITLNGAKGGGLSEDETKLNPKGYWIQGSSTDYNLIVEEKVKTDLTLDNVEIIRGVSLDEKANCMIVSHADVTITLVGYNQLLCNSGGTDDVRKQGAALTKNGMDGSLVIQCEHVNEKDHKCDDECGTLIAKGKDGLWHAGAIGSATQVWNVEKESGFANFEIKGGNIEASGGTHCPGIGSACVSENSAGGYTKNIRISGGNVKATGTENGSGIGSGYGNKVDGIYITGGTVEATGGSNAPGIGASKCDNMSTYPKQSMITTNIHISGGDTRVTAIGDETTHMPGIGSGGGNEKVSDVTAIPNFGFQGYIQDGTSKTDYTFVDGTPFKEETAIEVGKFYTMVYFGPFRDTNEIEKDSKEQIGANHVISKSGGQGFTEQQLKGLTKVTGKQKDGTDFPGQDLTFVHESQIEAINEAKTAGKTGEFDLTFTTPNGTETTVKVYLKAEGTDAAQMNPDKMRPTIGADDFQKDTGGAGFSDDEVRSLAGVQGKDEEGTTHPQQRFTVNEEQLAVINRAKESGKGGTFELTFTSPDQEEATVTVTLKVYDKTAVDETSGETIKGLDIISRTGGKGFTEEQLKDLSDASASDGDGKPIERNLLQFPDVDQIKAINEAKTSGEIGDYPLKIAAPGGTEITILVQLRGVGTDVQESGRGAGSLAASGTVQPTGGEAFQTEEILKLCGAKGKDAYGNNMIPELDQKQFLRINQAKTAGKTGEFPLQFALADGKKTEVTVKLTGEHTVTFDPDGGDYQPKDQIMEGGKTAVEPKEPKKAGYIFEGWFYTDADGRETKWDFDTSVHESMTLKAKWKKEPDATSDSSKNDNGEHSTKQDKTTKKGKADWNYKELTQRTEVEKTGEQSHSLWIALGIAGAAGAAACVLGRKRKTK